MKNTHLLIISLTVSLLFLLVPNQTLAGKNRYRPLSQELGGLDFGFYYSIPLFHDYHVPPPPRHYYQHHGKPYWRYYTRGPYKYYKPHVRPHKKHYRPPHRGYDKRHQSDRRYYKRHNGGHRPRHFQGYR